MEQNHMEIKFKRIKEKYYDEIYDIFTIDKNIIKIYIIKINNNQIGIIGINNINNLFYNIHQQYQIYNNIIFNKFFNTLSKDIILSINIENNDKNKIKQFIQIGFVKHSSDNQYLKFNYYIKHHHVLKLKYPYLKNFISLKEIKHNLLMLQKYQPIINNGSLKNGFTDNMSININFNKEREMNRITDYFTDKCRVKCVFGKKYLSPYEYYKNNKGKIVMNSLKNNEFDIDLFESNMYHEKLMKFCNNFQSTIALTLYKIFDAKHVFDSSSGWGDRLIAAIALNIKYTGVDPSKCLKPLYTKIINTLATNKNNYKINNMGIESMNMIENTYDLCFTSPPFFDLEVYENNDNQSIVKYNTQESWEKSFLITLADQNIKGLIVNGHIVLYIPDYYKHFMKYMNNHKQLKYKGIFSFYTPIQRKIFVWQKIC